MKYLKGLDTLRAFAVLIVIIQHWGPHKFKSGILTFIFSRLIPEGTFGVDLFFVLSGFLISKILFVASDKAAPVERLHVIKNFYFRRVLRIFPVYFLLVLLVVFVLNDTYAKEHIAYFLTYTSNFLTLKTVAWGSIAHTWSLAVEEQFYIVWPWIIIYTPKKYLFGVILISIILGLVSSVILRNMYGPFFYLLPLPCITAFAIGALYAYVENYGHFKRLTTNILLILLPGSLALLFWHNMGKDIVLIRVVNSIVSINLIIYVCRENYNIVTRFIFNNKVLVNIGKISYGIYLYHYILPKYYNQFVNYLATKVTLSDKLIKMLTFPPSGYLIDFVLVLLTAVISYKFIELPFLRLKKNFAYLSDKPVAVKPNEFSI
ncbi:acyltransferase [Mucilaginibacter sp.]|uniref:acyltransferase family protein n=1 Tax=Mucilaginibacter sp. TaxID=1882438 RepID=UPI0025D77E8D|nr:acyltransferase [Mucilaginibacter sp.]